MTKFLNIYNKFFSIPKNKNQSSIKGACDIVLSGGKLPYDKYEKAWGIAIHCGFNNLMCFDFDIKNLSEEGEEFVRNTFSMFRKFLEKRFNKEDYYIEKSKSGGYHVIFNLNEGVAQEFKTDKKFLKYKEKGVVELLCAGKNAWITVAPTEGYEPMHGNLLNLMPLTHAMALEVNDFFMQFKPKQEYKKGNEEYIADYLCDTLGQETVMQALGYTYIGKRSGCASYQTYDLNPTARTPSAGFRYGNNYFYDFKEEIGFHAGEEYFKLIYNSDVQAFSQDFQDFYRKKKKNNDIENEETNNIGEFKPMYAYFQGDEKFIRFKHEGKEYDFSAKNFRSNGTLTEWLFTNNFYISDDADVRDFKNKLLRMGGAPMPMKEPFAHCRWDKDDFLMPENDKYIKNTTQLFAQKGSVDQWITNVWEPVKQDRFAQLVVCASIAGAYAGKSFNNNLGIHLSGDANTGKTTLMRLASSVWGNFSQHVNSWSSTYVGMLDEAKNYCNSTFVLDDMTFAGKSAVQAVMDVLLGYERSKHGTSSSNKEIISLILMGTSEQPLESCFRRVEVDTSAGLLSRYIDITINNRTRLTLEREFDRSLDAMESYHGSLIRHVTQKIKPSQVKEAIRQANESMCTEIEMLEKENKRIARNFCVLNAIGTVLQNENIIDLPNFSQNLDKILRHVLGIVDWNDRQQTTVERTVINILNKVLNSGEYCCFDNDKAILPKKFCVIKRYAEAMFDDEVEYYLNPKPFWQILQNETNITKSQFLEVCKVLCLIDTLKIVRSKVLGVKGLYKINQLILDNLN